MEYAVGSAPPALTLHPILGRPAVAIVAVAAVSYRLRQDRRCLIAAYNQ
jgi:hypothetical protein